MHAGVFRMRYVSLGAGDEGSGVKVKRTICAANAKKAALSKGFSNRVFRIVTGGGGAGRSGALALRPRYCLPEGLLQCPAFTCASCRPSASPPWLPFPAGG